MGFGVVDLLWVLLERRSWRRLEGKRSKCLLNPTAWASSFLVFFLWSPRSQGWSWLIWFSNIILKWKIWESLCGKRENKRIQRKKDNRGFNPKHLKANIVFRSFQRLPTKGEINWWLRERRTKLWRPQIQGRHRHLLSILAGVPGGLSPLSNGLFDLRSGHDLSVLSSSPASGSEPAWDSVSAFPLLVHSLNLSIRNKLEKRKKQKVYLQGFLIHTDKHASFWALPPPPTFLTSWASAKTCHNMNCENGCFLIN